MALGATQMLRGEVAEVTRLPVRSRLALRGAMVYLIGIYSLHWQVVCSGEMLEILGDALVLAR